MTKIIIAAGGILTVVLSFIIFSFPLYISGVIIGGIALGLLGVFRADDLSKEALIALDVLFMLLIMIVFSRTWVPETIELFMVFISVSMISGGVESIIFANKKMNPALGLLFTVLFWMPLSVPVYFLVERKMGVLGGVIVLAVLFLIVVRDIYRRKADFQD